DGGGRDELRRTQPNARDPFVVRRHARSREKRFDASALAAVTERPRGVLRVRPRQRVVSPFARDAVGAADDASVDHDATADTGPGYHAEHNRVAGSSAVGGLRHGEAIRIIRDADRTAKTRFEISLQGLAD